MPTRGAKKSLNDDDMRLGGGSLITSLRNPVLRRPKWWLIDAQGQRTGRLGKHKPIYTPATDVGDYVVVINSEKIELTGRKWEKKLVRWYTGYPGGLKERPAGQYHERFPDRLLKRAVLGMLPKNALREKRENRLRIFPGPDHDHHQQCPEPYALHKTKGDDQTAPWGLVPEYKVTFEKVAQAPGEEPVWVLTTDEPRLTKKDKYRLKVLKRQGKLGPSNRRKPHPEGYERAGAPRPGVLHY